MQIYNCSIKYSLGGNIMKRTMLCALLIAALLAGLWAGGLASAQDYRWSMVRMGGKEVNNTRVTGTNDAGWLVGNWWGHRNPGDPGGAFRFSKQQFISLAVPGAIRTEVADIESSSTIVGNAWVPDGQGGEVMHAFLYKHGMNAFDLIDIPGAFLIYPFRVNEGRQVAVGFFHEVNGGTAWGTGVYDWATKQLTQLAVFGTTDLVIRGLNNHGEMVGSYAAITDDPCPCQLWDAGFYRDATGQEHELIAPDGWPVTPHAINDRGVVVGRIRDSGFRWDLNSGAFEEIQHPTRREGFYTEIVDIDNLGRMAAINVRHSDGYVESWWLRPK
jgi:hypothetical protein